MGTVFKPIVTKPLPAGAEVFELDGVRMARWRSARGGVQTAPVRTTPRGECVAVQSGKYLARYKDGQGVTQTVATGCRDEANARAVLGQLERRAELVLAGVLSPAEDAIADHRQSSITSHVEAYLASLKAKGNTATHVVAQRRLLSTVITGCGFKTLADIRREPVERWLASGPVATRSARTRNSYAASAKWFCNWCVNTERLVASPLARIPRADENADRRRQPRALPEEELVRLLDAAQRRPLVEALKYNRGWRRGQPGARLRPETRAKLERLGRERALIYKTLVLTGLRQGELASIRICDIVGDTIVLDPRHEKARRGATIPLRLDLADDLRRWIESEAAPRERLLFRVPSGLVKVMNRDLKFAGIAKHDERGRTTCVHGLRHSFATHMSRGGVAPRVAQAAMRVSTMDLVMQVYTDPRLLDVAGALKVLPDLPLDAPATEIAAGAR